MPAPLPTHYAGCAYSEAEKKALRAEKERLSKAIREMRGFYRRGPNAITREAIAEFSGYSVQAVHYAISEKHFHRLSLFCMQTIHEACLKLSPEYVRENSNDT